MIPWRRPLALVACAAAVTGLVMADQEAPAAPPPPLVGVEPPLQPVAPADATALSTAWYCPGVPADADRSASGSISIYNRQDAPLSLQVTYTPTEGEPVTRPATVEARTRLVLEPSDVLVARFVAVLVEVEGVGAVVEQTTRSGAGTSISPCASAPSPVWYAADGTTTADAQYSLLISNPFPDDAIVDLSFATDEGLRTPQPLQGYVVPARSVRVVDVDEAVRRSAILSLAVEARNGRVVVGRYQTHRSLRRGLVAGLVAPAAGSTWLFPDGAKGPGRRERVVVFNPGDADAEVDVNLVPAQPSDAVAIEPLSVTVAPGGTEVVDISASEVVPEGQHSIRVTSPADRPVVVERVVDRGEVQGNVGAATTSAFGSLLTGGRWYLVAGAPAGSVYSLTILNPGAVSVTAAVQVPGETGEIALPGRATIEIPAAGSVLVDLSTTSAAADAVIVDATGPVVVDRVVVPPEEGTGATAALGIVQG